MYRVQKAIIMAAGLGSRLRPLTDPIPKPLLPVQGKPMIERLIDQLNEVGVKDVYVVTGHLHEQFDYLSDRVTLIYNPDYLTCNNISSLYAAKDHLSQCMILDADLIVTNTAILSPSFERSCYCSVRINEWVQRLNEQGIVTETLRNTAYQLYSISFWAETDAQQLKKDLEEVFLTHKDLFWDDIVHFVKKENYQLGVREIQDKDLLEIDTLEEYRDYEK